MALSALSDTNERGLVRSRRSAVLLNEYQLDIDAVRTRPEYERPEPQLVEEGKSSLPAPRTRRVEAVQVSFYGKKLDRHHQGPLLVAEDSGTATVSRCGSCEDVAINEMIATPVLQFVEEKAKTGTGRADASTARNQERAVAKAARKRRSRSPTPSNGASSMPASGGRAPSSPAGPDNERVTAVQRYLSTWKPVLGYAPSRSQAEKIAELLGECPIDQFGNRCERRRQYIERTAQSYGVFRPMALECGKSWSAEHGSPCPGCGKHNLKPGQICSFCGPPLKEKRLPRPEHPDWDPVRAALEQRLPERAFENWVAHTYGLGSVNGVLRVAVDDETTREWIQEEYAEALAAALTAEHGDRFERVEFVVQEGGRDEG
jgi:hypothetical protein